MKEPTNKWQIVIINDQERPRISVWGSRKQIDQSFSVWATEDDLWEGWTILMVDPEGNVVKKKFHKQGNLRRRIER